MLFGAVLLWALNVTVSKYLLEHGWHPLAYGTIRYFAAIVLFWVFTYARERSFRIARSDLKLVLLAAATIFVNQICFVYSLQIGQASTLALLFGTTPVFVALLGLALRHDRLQRSFWAGAAITFLGVVLIGFGTGGGNREQPRPRHRWRSQQRLSITRNLNEFQHGLVQVPREHGQHRLPVLEEGHGLSVAQLVG